MKFLCLTICLCVFFTNAICQKSISIGKYIWATENVSALKFNNGEVIPEAKNVEEWKSYINLKKPACFIVINKDGSKDILYNIYAVFDKRGLIPEGWQLTNESQFNDLNDELKKLENKELAIKFNFKGSIQISNEGIYDDDGAVFWSVFDDRNLKNIGALNMQIHYVISCGYLENEESRPPPFFNSGDFCGLESRMLPIDQSSSLRLVKK